MQDLFNNIKVVPVIDPADNADIGTTPIVGEVIDRQGYESVTYILATGALTDADAVYSVLLEESDEDDANFEAVADADLLGTEAAAGFTFENDGEVRTLGYIGHKRFTQLTVTPTTTAQSGNTPIAAVAILGHAHDKPVS